MIAKYYFLAPQNDFLHNILTIGDFNFSSVIFPFKQSSRVSIYVLLFMTLYQLDSTCSETRQTRQEGLMENKRQLSEAMQPAHRALSNKREGMTAEQRIETMQPALNAPRPKDDALWTSKYKKLEAIKTVNGDLHLPKSHELYGWEDNQRTYKKNNKLCKEKIASLNGLGFVWFPRLGKRG
jgi:hypothetical protein